MARLREQDAALAVVMNQLDRIEARHEPQKAQQPPRIDGDLSARPELLDGGVDVELGVQVRRRNRQPLGLRS